MRLFGPPRSLFEPPSRLELILSSPLRYLVIAIHHLLLKLRGSPQLPSLPNDQRPIRLVCLSDTHNNIPSSVPDGDILIHAGDLTNGGTVSELQAQLDWLGSLPHTHKIAIAGNHDTWLDLQARLTLSESDRAVQSLDWHDVHYLQHQSIELKFPKLGSGRRLIVFGAPQIPHCGPQSFAFQYPRGQDAWTDTVPNNTDVLVTHAPPKYHLDLPAGLGCNYLLAESYRVRPKLHVFGHIHAARGRETIWWDDAQSAYERVCARKGRGLLRTFFDIQYFIDIIRIVLYNIAGILWARIWKGKTNAGILVNAALCNNKGMIGNEPQVVDL